uniref:Retrotransposon Copia-like N-terminal domain-containing protein n=1 Tax=Opuntia streptacantha TaxID=393608 RepID=A0A7C9A909_OPUST
MEIITKLVWTYINALKSKNKLEFVNGTLEKPSTAPDVHAWEKCDSMVLAWLYKVIDKALHLLHMQIQPGKCGLTSKRGIHKGIQSGFINLNERCLWLDKKTLDY